MIFELSGVVSSNSVNSDQVQIKIGSGINKRGSGKDKSFVQSKALNNLDPVRIKIGSGVNISDPVKIK